MLSIAIVISGRGSNMRSIIEAKEKQYLDIDIKAVVSNKPDAAGIQYAADKGYRTEIVDQTLFEDRDSYNRTLKNRLEQLDADLIVLAGYMRILPPELVDTFAGRMINIHPSLLPEFTGLNTHRRALDAGKEKHGASVHFVTAELDGGPVIAQAEVPILKEDTEEILAQRVLQQEHRLYPAVIKLFEQNRIKCSGNYPVLDDAPLTEPITINANSDITNGIT